jgi:hypothetical protein
MTDQDHTRLIAFVYLLARDHLPLGTLNRVASDAAFCPVAGSSPEEAVATKIVDTLLRR